MTSLFPKDDFNFDDHICWIMHCAEGPVPNCSIRAMEDFLLKEAKPWKIDFHKDFEQLPASTKKQVAELLGVCAEDITLTATTSAGLVLIAQGMDWEEGDEILLPAGEFPSNIWPWKALERLGVTIRQIPLWEGHKGGKDALQSAPPIAGQKFEENLIQAISPKTKLVAASWVRFQDGIKLNLERLAEACNEKKVHLVIDGIQGAGTLPTIPKGLSAFSSGAHKGLLTPQGSGFLWTSSEFRALLKPLGSWLSVEDATNFSRPSSDINRSWKQDGSYLEQGVPNLIGCAGFNASLSYINQFSGETRLQHIQILQKELLTALQEFPSWQREAERLMALLKSDRLGSILSFYFGSDTQTPANLLASGFKTGIFASAREGYLRIALHGWHQSSDIKTILSWLKQY